MSFKVAKISSDNELLEISKLHQRNLYWTLNSRMGITHLNNIYQITAEHSKSVVLGSFEKNRCIGSVSLTWNYSSLKLNIQRKSWRTFLGYFLMKPGSFVKEVIAYKKMSALAPELINSAYLLTCFVDKDFRNRGVARSLVHQSLEHLPENTKWLIVDVDFEARGGREFYERCGFKLWFKGTESSILVWELEK
jgi:ribosomal protein S18 acetylase RimI-like enzyme